MVVEQYKISVMKQVVWEGGPAQPAVTPVDHAICRYHLSSPLLTCIYRVLPFRRQILFVSEM